MSDCPVAIGTLADYWAAALTGDEERAVEEHLFACDRCARRSELVRSLADGVRRVVQSGGGTILALTSGLVEQLERDGVKLRRYRAAPGERVACTVGADDDFVVTYLTAPLAGDEPRLDVTRTAAGKLARLVDVPVDRDTGCIIYALPGTLVRTLPSATVDVRLVAVDADGRERELGRYAFEHTAFQRAQ